MEDSSEFQLALQELFQERFIVDSYSGDTGSTHYLKINFGVVVLSHSFRMRVGVLGVLGCLGLQRRERQRQRRDTEGK